MKIEVVVEVEIDTEPKLRSTEQLLEDEVVSVIAKKLASEKSISVKKVSLLSLQHCLWALREWTLEEALDNLATTDPQAHKDFTAKYEPLAE